MRIAWQSITRLCADLTISDKDSVILLLKMPSEGGNKYKLVEFFPQEEEVFEFGQEHEIEEYERQGIKYIVLE